MYFTVEKMKKKKKKKKKTRKVENFAAYNSIRAATVNDKIIC